MVIDIQFSLTSLDEEQGQSMHLKMLQNMLIHLMLFNKLFFKYILFNMLFNIWQRTRFFQASRYVWIYCHLICLLAILKKRIKRLTLAVDNTNIRLNKSQRGSYLENQHLQGDPYLVCLLPRVTLLVNFIYDSYKVLRYNIFPKDILYVHVPALSYIGNCPFCIKDHIESSFYDISEL